MITWGRKQLHELNTAARCDCDECKGEAGRSRITEIQQGCHPGAGLRVAYEREAGVLLLRCTQCAYAFAEVLVGDNDETRATTTEVQTLEVVTADGRTATGVVATVARAKPETREAASVDKALN